MILPLILAFSSSLNLSIGINRIKESLSANWLVFCTKHNHSLPINTGHMIIYQWENNRSVADWSVPDISVYKWAYSHVYLAILVTCGRKTDVRFLSVLCSFYSSSRRSCFVLLATIARRPGGGSTVLPAPRTGLECPRVILEQEFKEIRDVFLAADQTAEFVWPSAVVEDTSPRVRRVSSRSVTWEKRQHRGWRRLPWSLVRVLSLRWGPAQASQYRVTKVRIPRRRPVLKQDAVTITVPTCASPPLLLLPFPILPPSTLHKLNAILKKTHACTPAHSRPACSSRRSLSIAVIVDCRGCHLLSRFNFSSRVILCRIT